MNLGGLILQFSNLPFGPATDCCQFAGKAVEIQSGVNPMAGLSYATDEEGAALLEKLGGLEKAVSYYLGNPTSLSGAVDGDIVLAEINGQDILGVIYKMRCVFRLRTGLVDLPLRAARLTWMA